MKSRREDYRNCALQEVRREHTFQPLASRDSPTPSPRATSQDTMQNSRNLAHILPDNVGHVARRFYWRYLVLWISNIWEHRNHNEVSCAHLIPFLQSFFNDKQVNDNSRLSMEQAVSTELEILRQHLYQFQSPLTSDRTFFWEYEDNQRNEASSMESGVLTANELECEVRQVVDALKEVNLHNPQPVMFKICLHNGHLSTFRMIPQEVDIDSEEEYASVHCLSEHEMQLLTVKKITQEHLDLEMACSTCMDNFRLDEEVRELPCQHKFHSSCIFPWFRRGNTCPVCRAVVVDQVT